MWLETTNFGQIAYSHSTRTHRRLLGQILSHYPQTPPNPPQLLKMGILGKWYIERPNFCETRCPH